MELVKHFKLGYALHYISMDSTFKEKGKNLLGFPGVLDSKESACNAEDPGSIPGLGRSPGEGNGYPLQYSCLANSMDREAWRGHKESGMAEQLIL